MIEPEPTWTGLSQTIDKLGSKLVLKSFDFWVSAIWSIIRTSELSRLIVIVISTVPLVSHNYSQLSKLSCQTRLVETLRARQGRDSPEAGSYIVWWRLKPTFHFPPQHFHQQQQQPTGVLRSCCSDFCPVVVSEDWGQDGHNPVRGCCHGRGEVRSVSLEGLRTSSLSTTVRLPTFANHWRDRETERQRDRETERQRDRETIRSIISMELDHRAGLITMKMFQIFFETLIQAEPGQNQQIWQKVNLKM